MFSFSLSTLCGGERKKKKTPEETLPVKRNFSFENASGRKKNVLYNVLIQKLTHKLNDPNS